MTDALYLDEMDGALDAENASHFVDMLRKAMEMGSLRQILFVSHRSACIDGADHVLRVQDGRVEVMR